MMPGFRRFLAGLALLMLTAWASDDEGYSGHEAESNEACESPTCDANDDVRQAITYGDFIHTQWGAPQVIQSEHDLKKFAEVSYYMLTEGHLTVAFQSRHEKCWNNNMSCISFAANGDCETRSKFMEKNCAPACRMCTQVDEGGDSSDADEPDDETSSEPRSVSESGQVVHDRIVEYLEDLMPLVRKEEFVRDALGIELGVPQNHGQSPAANRVWLEAFEYMVSEVLDNEDYEDVAEICVNKHEECTMWAVRGICKTNKSFMLPNCAPVCKSCKMFRFEERCPKYGEPYRKAWPEPGSVDRAFRRIVSDPYFADSYGPLEVLSSPDTGGPWVVTLDNFLSKRECDQIIERGSIEGYKRSWGRTETNEDGTFFEVESDDRTSANAWCYEDCMKNETIKSVLQRVENLTGVPSSNYEHLQLLHYETGQFYQEHHDYIDAEVDKEQGPRILTVFMYLNEVEAGGGTRFSRLNVTVMPKPGRVVLWPSVLDASPMFVDPRTHHEALPVEAGEKYGANAWVHQGDFQAALANSCHR